MGVFSGTITATAYRVPVLPEDWNKVFEEMTRARFKPLDPSSAKELSMGWVLTEDPFSTEFNRNAVFYGSTLTLTLRVDQISVPGTQLKLHVQRELKERLKKEGREHFSRKEQEEIMEEIKFDLIRRTLPMIKLAEVVWNTDSGRAWFFSRSPSMVEPFEELFRETFGVQLYPETPYAVAASLVGEAEADHMLDWDQALLVEPRY